MNRLWSMAGLKRTCDAKAGAIAANAAWERVDRSKQRVVQPLEMTRLGF